MPRSYPQTILNETVVPRTFLGPLILSSCCQLVRFLCLPIFDIATKPLLVQFLARFVLLAFNLVGWIRVAIAVDHRYNNRDKMGKSGIGTWLLLITASQFHIPFYSSRMLPNTFALAVVLQAYGFWMRGKIDLAAACIVFATAIFRCDILLLLGSTGLSWLLLRQLTIGRALTVGILTGIVSLALTVPFDSLMWQRPLWPEGEVFYFNTILGKSSDWGTSPWHWYFTSALPKSMLLTLLLVPLSVIRLPEALSFWERRIRQSSLSGSASTVHPNWIDTECLPFLVPILGFVVLYSNLGHKEMRFIFPALPILNLAAAATMARLVGLAFPSKEKRPAIISRLAFVCGVMCVVLTMAGNLAFVAVSRWNYPGGDGLLGLVKHIQKQVEVTDITNTHVRVHVDVASAMSGVSLFGQRAAESLVPTVHWTFDKGGYESENSVVDDYGVFTHILSEKLAEFPSDFVVIESIPGSPRLDIKRLQVQTTPTIYVLEKKEFWQKQEQEVAKPTQVES